MNGADVKWKLMMSMNGVGLKWKLTMSMNEAEAKESKRGRCHIRRFRHLEAILAAHVAIVIIVVDRPAIGL